MPRCSEELIGRHAIRKTHLTIGSTQFQPVTICHHFTPLLIAAGVMFILSLLSFTFIRSEEPAGCINEHYCRNAMSYADAFNPLRYFEACADYCFHGEGYVSVPNQIFVVFVWLSIMLAIIWGAGALSDHTHKNRSHTNPFR